MMFFVANRVYVQRGKARQASSARPPGFQGGDQVLASDAKARYVQNSSSKRARARLTLGLKITAFGKNANREPDD